MDKPWQEKGDETMKKLVYIFLFLSIKIHASTFAHDVVIFGAGGSGVSAAIQTAKVAPDLSIALVEETDWIGGQLTAASVSTMDGGDKLSGVNSHRYMSSSIYADFIERIKSYYANFRIDGKIVNKTIRTCYWNSNSPCFEPKVGQLILEQMLQEVSASVSVYKRRRIESAQTINANTRRKLTSVTVQNTQLDVQEVFNAAVFIDATEYGDLIRVATDDYRAGARHHKPLSQCVQDATYVAVVKKYTDRDPMPDELNFNSAYFANIDIESKLGYTPNDHLQFQAFVLKEGGLDDHIIENDKLSKALTWRYHNAYRGMPDSSNATYQGANDYNAKAAKKYPGIYEKITKTAINLANDYPYSIDSLLNRQARKINNCAAKLKTLKFLYYMQSAEELGQSSWAIANDQGFDTAYNIEENSCDNIAPEFKEIEKHFSAIPYIRESVRLNGEYTLTGKDIWRGPQSDAKKRKNFSTVIALGDYAVDLHGCNTDEHLDFGDSESDNPGWNNYIANTLFQIPYESLIAKNYDGLLAAEKNISQSRLANGATRLQPSTMNIGQAAGAIAALAIEQAIELRDVDPVNVQKVLINGVSPIISANQKSPLSVYKMTDVPMNHWAWNSVQHVSINRILVGNGVEFLLNQYISREQVSVGIIKAADHKLVSPSSPSFVDVPVTSPFYKFIETMKAANITAGCASNKFCPKSYISREHMAIFIVKAFDIDLIPTGGFFSDVPANVIAPYINTLKYMGIVSGCGPTTFCPKDKLTRGSAAAMLNNARMVLGYKNREF